VCRRALSESSSICCYHCKSGYFLLVEVSMWCAAHIAFVRWRLKRGRNTHPLRGQLRAAGAKRHEAHASSPHRMYSTLQAWGWGCRSRTSDESSPIQRSRYHFPRTSLCCSWCVNFSGFQFSPPDEEPEVPHLRDTFALAPCISCCRLRLSCVYAGSGGAECRGHPLLSGRQRRA